MEVTGILERVDRYIHYYVLCTRDFFPATYYLWQNGDTFFIFFFCRKYVSLFFAPDCVNFSVSFPFSSLFPTFF